MRFESIQLQKYGAFTLRELDLSDTSGLVIIYGPNEAGKSTLLSAITDLLYGVPHLSPYGAIFGNNQMRIDATIRLADGSALTLRRKKGRPPGDLTDLLGTPITHQLDSLLSGTDRDRFGALFGLDHVSLRQGGQKLLASDGEIGRLIVEAGGGLRSLIYAMSELQAEADNLFTQNKSNKRQFYQALDAFQAADKQAKLATTTRESFLKSQKVALVARSALVDLRAQQSLAREGISRLDRIRRVAPQLQSLAEMETTLANFADVEELSAGLAAEINNEIAALETDRVALTGADETLARIEAQLGQLVVTDKIVNAAAEIEEAAALATNVESARRSMPKRVSELAEINAQLDSLRRLLSIGSDEDLETRAPSRAAIDEIQSLAASAVTLNADMKAARARRLEVAESLDALRQKQVKREAGGFDRPAPVSAMQLSALSVSARNLESRHRQIAETQSSIEADAKALGIGSAANLSRQIWPSSKDVKLELEAIGALTGEKREKHAELVASRKRAEQAASRLARLASGAPPPTPSAIDEVRSDRDTAWAEIRALYLDASDHDWKRPQAQERSVHATQFEHAQGAADGLADQRDQESQRLADIAAAERDREDADIESERIRAEITDIEQIIADRGQAWANAWPTALPAADNLPRLMALAEAREDLMTRQARVESARSDLIELETDVHDLMQLLSHAEQLARSDPEPTLAIRVQNAVVDLKRHEDLYGDYRRDAEAIATLTSREKRANEEITRLASDREEWVAAWSQKVAILGLPPTATSELAIEVATEWVSAAGAFTAIQLTTTRIRRINEDDETLRNQIATLRTRISADLPDDAVAAAHQLQRLLQESSSRALQREALLPQLETARFDKDIMDRRVASSTAALADIAKAINCDTDDLRGIAARIADRVELQVKIDAVRQSILAAGDGHPLEFLTEQWQQQDPDGLAARLVELDKDVARRDTEIEAAIAAQHSADTEAKTFLDDDRLNGLIAERESASAEMHRVIERYAEITLAQSLLKAAIETVRAEQQDPLLSRASELFTVCTRGEFLSIDTDVSQDGEPIVVGRRPEGQNVNLSEMSDGTRDQLFLAFRLASIEHYSQNAEPLPLIADDVLVHFDDERGRATLELLADLGSTTQVLLFTHHEAVLASASVLVAEGRASIIELHN